MHRNEEKKRAEGARASRLRRMAFAASIILLTSNAVADGWMDEMRSHFVCLRDGVSVREYTYESPRKMKVYVARIDLATPGIGFAATGRAASWGEPITPEMAPNAQEGRYRVETLRETTQAFMERMRAAGRNVEVAFNTTPWRPFPAPAGFEACDPIGLCIADGAEVSAREGGEGLFIVRTDGSCEIKPAAGLASTEDIAYAAAAFDVIMTNGVDAVAVNMPEGGIHPRLALGLDAAKKTLVVVAVDGRQPERSQGADIADLRAIFRAEGVTDAVNMDGGGSTSLVVWDEAAGRARMLNRHADGNVRADAVNFGIVFGAEAPAAEERGGAVLHSYEFGEIADTPPPAGYAPFYISHYGRHGSRRLTGGILRKAMAVLAAADAAGALTGEGRALFADMRRLADAHDGATGQLTLRGAGEQKKLARRMATRFWQVFSGARRVRCQSSYIPRVLASMANFTSSLKDEKPRLEFDFSTGEKPHRVINPGHYECNDPAFTNGIAEAVAAVCRANIAPGGLKTRLFARDYLLGDDAAREFARNLFACASICQCLRCELDGLSLYRYFTAEEQAALSRCLETECFAKMSGSEEFGDAFVAASRRLWRDIAARAGTAIADGRIAADLRFGHDSGLWPLAAFIGLEGPGDRAPIAGAHALCPAWKWMPMAANIQIVFYRAKEGEILVKFLWNERETPVRGLAPVSGPYYRWRDVCEKLAAR